MTTDIESLRTLCTNTVRMYERNIKYSDIKLAIMKGEIIEEYPNELPYPCVLILGYDMTSNPLHVVVGVGDWNIEIVTVYRPSLERWDVDYKTRKVIE